MTTNGEPHQCAAAGRRAQLTARALHMSEQRLVAVTARQRRFDVPTEPFELGSPPRSGYGISPYAVSV
jgi:hypothetical protein